MIVFALLLICLVAAEQIGDAALYRALIRVENKKLIDQHNGKAGATYKMRLYERFASKTLEEIKAQIFMTTHVKVDRKIMVSSPPQSKSFVQKFNFGTNIYIDWRDKGMIPPVRDQGYCGSCYAHTAISDIQSSYRMKGKNISLSIQQIIDCSNNFDNGGCGGGWMANVFQYVMAHGVTLQQSYPDRPQTMSLGQAGSCSKRKGQFRIRGYAYTSYRMYDCASLTNIIKKRPVTVGVYASAPFVFYSQGIFNGCQPIVWPQVNHALVVAGMVQNPFQNYWICRNSWGVTWGQEGYIKIDRYIDYGNHCQICIAPHYSII